MCENQNRAWKPCVRPGTFAQCANHDVFVLRLDFCVDLFVDVALDFTRNLDLR